MKKRLFVAILLPEEKKKELNDIQKSFRKINIRWIKTENIHFTVVFLGWLEEEKVEKIKEILKGKVEKISSFFLKLDRIILGPNEKKPRMIWAVGPCTLELNKLRKVIIEDLENNNIDFENSYSLKLHITLARARNRELNGKRIDENLDLIFSVKEICLMESELKPEGAEYKILDLIKLEK